MEKETRLILETLSTLISFERDGVLQNIWDKKIEIDKLLEDDKYWTSKGAGKIKWKNKKNLKH